MRSVSTNVAKEKQREERRTRIPSVIDRCPRCNNLGESFMHCLVQCPLAVDVWNQVGITLPFDAADPIPFWRWWLNLMEALQQRSQRRSQASLVANVLWRLWLDKNQRIFERTSSSARTIVAAAVDLNREFHRYHPP
ncbi:hypothetical protein PIB30_045877 [Stylosanthes scabra]|uniref:Reverse transcriptase zinc-binding domain-containing protein n=1 Tax=Stylosanthes scabra TaxID=79078 RepID=A0ABU6RGU4_9FABA|nr:hypothetical protein [Stylosanthes scabra]